MDAMTIPPKIGMAIGIMMSLPRPDEVKIGNKAIKVVAVVMTAGLILRRPASVVAFRISAMVLGFFFWKF